ncbi:unnamed protein product [Camellia sinensis]
MEVRDRASLLREVRVRARHGKDAPNAKDPRTRGQFQALPQTGHHSSHSQDRQCLIPPQKKPTTSINPWSVLLIQSICVFFFFYKKSLHCFDFSIMAIMHNLGFLDGRLLACVLGLFFNLVFDSS